MGAAFALARLGWRARRRPLAEIRPQRILVLESHLIGDVVLLTPLLRALAGRFPEAEITLLANAWAGELLAECPWITRLRVLRYPWATFDYSPSSLGTMLREARRLRRERFDLALDSRGDMRNNFLLWLIGARRRLGFAIGALHRASGGAHFLTDVAPPPDDRTHLAEVRFAVLHSLGIDEAPGPVELPVQSAAAKWAGDFLHRSGLAGARTIAVHPGASLQMKRWPVSRVAEFVGRVRREGFAPLLVGGPDEGPLLAAVREQVSVELVTLRTSLPRLVALLREVRALVCMDSGPGHLAAAVGTPVVALFGPTPAEGTRPYTDRSRAVVAEGFDCGPCVARGHCLHGEKGCMSSLTADAVWEALCGLLG